MDKLILLSEMFHVSIDYLIKDHYESVHEEDNDSLYFMNNEKIQEYMTFKKTFCFTNWNMCFSNYFRDCSRYSFSR